jgi:hypothetical protein
VSLFDRVKPRSPAAAVLRLGQKTVAQKPGRDGKSYWQATGMEDKGLFSWAEAREDERGVRRPHPSFDWYNSLDPAMRRGPLRVRLVNARLDDAMESGLSARVGPRREEVPGGRPWCSSSCDGGPATRWMGEAHGWRAVPCTDECEHLLAKRCKPLTRLLFVPVWKPPKPGEAPRPTPLTRYSTGAWSTTASLAGVRRAMLEAAESLGLTDPSFYGVVLRMTAVEETRKAKDGQPGRRFPMVRFEIDCDLQEVLVTQTRLREEARRAGQPLPAEAAKIADLTPEEAAEDLRELAGPGLDLSPLPRQDGR